LALVSILLGYLSWRFVEMPFRRSKPRENAKTVFVRSGLATVLLCGVASLIYIAQGIPQRFPQQTVRLASYAGSINPEGDRCRDVALQLAPHSGCTIGNNADAETFLWGDSHAGALYGALEAMAKNGESTVYGATPQCPPLVQAGTSLECIDANRKKLEFVLANDKIKTVILAARWSLYLDGRFTSNGDAENNNGVPVLSGAHGQALPLFSAQTRRTFRKSLSTLVDKLLDDGKHVILVYPVPETGYDIPSTLALLSEKGTDPASFTTSYAAYVERQSNALRILDGLGTDPMLTRIYPADIFCASTRCLTYAHGSPLYFDSHHLSIPGARMLQAQLERAVHQPQS
jgi:SGNH domain (fused to AT3 domains)